jgi:benzoyl-CoA reductase/2-hydroxyglutaryl-CoA dehydratase subunit BcrC/BadD/HgdB
MPCPALDFGAGGILLTQSLRWHYEHRAAEAIARHKTGVPVVGYTSNTVPWELIRAAGCFPILLGPDLQTLAHPTPHADKFMEPVFDPRIRGIFEEILSGAWSFLDLLVIPRTSEPEYKLYLYLREVERQQLSAAIPPLHFYDLLHTQNSISRTYGLNRTKDLLARLEKIGPVTSKSLGAAVVESNRARASLRKLQSLRLGPAPRISGTVALAISGASYFMERGGFAKLTEAACRKFKSAKPLRGPRLLIKGTPLHHPKLHETLEAHGAVVVAEDDWWGSRAASNKIALSRSVSAAVRAIFADYYQNAPSPRVSPAARADRWFKKSIQQGINGVIFYLPPDDDVYGWDYPRQRDFVASRKIPSLLIREDAASGLSAQATAEIESFIASLGGKRHGARR